jgi:hypothetical protein
MEEKESNARGRKNKEPWDGGGEDKRGFGSKGQIDFEMVE